MHAFKFYLDELSIYFNHFVILSKKNFFSFMQKRESKLPVSRKSIKQRARALAAERDFPEFQASEGWLFRFMKRKRLSLRRATTACQKASSDILDRIVRFILFVRALFLVNFYPLSKVYVADELGLWVDAPPETTIEEIGAREVAVRTTGHERMRITVLLAARADGRKLKPAVLIPRKRPIRALQRFRNQIHIIYSGQTSLMDETKLHEYLRQEIGRDIFGARKLLIWDAFLPHFSDRTRAVLRGMSIDLAVIPGIQYFTIYT